MIAGEHDPEVLGRRYTCETRSAAVYFQLNGFAVLL